MANDQPLCQGELHKPLIINIEPVYTPMVIVFRLMVGAERNS